MGWGKKWCLPDLNECSGRPPDQSWSRVVGGEAGGVEDGGWAVPTAEAKAELGGGAGEIE